MIIARRRATSFTGFRPGITGAIGNDDVGSPVAVDICNGAVSRRPLRISYVLTLIEVTRTVIEQNIVGIRPVVGNDEIQIPIKIHINRR
jgi:hypothetical protein